MICIELSEDESVLSDLDMRYQESEAASKVTIIMRFHDNHYART